MQSELKKLLSGAGAQTEKESLYGKNLSELEELCRAWSWPKFRAKQLFQALYQQHHIDFQDISYLSKEQRSFLSENYSLDWSPPEKVQEDRDGTCKMLFPVGQGAIESVLIPNKKGEHTLCVSSQLGCRWACVFCQTGEMGLLRNLSSGEILNQVRALRRGFKLPSGRWLQGVDRIVFMGMGEPLDNPALERTLSLLSDGQAFGFSPRRITVSTVGLSPQLAEFMGFERPYRLAISIHNPLSEERSNLIPAEHVYPLEEVLGVLAEHRDKRRVTLEYTLVDGENDQDYHAEALAEMALKSDARVNLLQCHPNNLGYLGSPEERLLEFQRIIENAGVRCTWRRSHGTDIAAACGMLLTQEDEEDEEGEA